VCVCVCVCGGGVVVWCVYGGGVLLEVVVVIEGMYIGAGGGG
jgi:hypothetical protein